MAATETGTGFSLSLQEPAPSLGRDAQVEHAPSAGRDHYSDAVSWSAVGKPFQH